MDRKRGETEAIIILKAIGIDVDETYHDDNSVDSMPDIKCKDGHFIEVTHTKHNDNYIEHGNIHMDKLDFESLRKKHPNMNENELEILHATIVKKELQKDFDCRDALERIKNGNYEFDDFGNMTIDSQILFKKDCEIVNAHLGYDPRKINDGHHFEFKCDCPTFSFSVDNIIRKIRDDKGSKYLNGDTDLFVFVTEDEFRLLQEILSQSRWNNAGDNFLNMIQRAPFNTVYICEWYFFKQDYNRLNPKMLILAKEDVSIKYRWYNCK